MLKACFNCRRRSEQIIINKSMNKIRALCTGPPLKRTHTQDILTPGSKV